MNPKSPDIEVQLTGTDGNAFSVMSQEQLRLSDETFASVVERAGAGDLVGALDETFAAFGVYLLVTDSPQLRPSDYAIPRDQWEAICGALAQSSDSDLSGANRAMDWVNFGPSGFEPS